MTAKLLDANALPRAPHFPKGRSSPALVDADVGSGASSGEIQTPPSVVYLTEISLGGSARRLGEPVKLEIERTEENRIVAFSPFLRAGGLGNTLSDAVFDLVDTMAALWIEFRAAAPGQLDREATELLAKLRRIFEG